MRYLAFVTDGLIDIRAFTHFGVNSKPNTENPIGFFGTGLKYAIAVLCRLGGTVTVIIDGIEHEFYSKRSDFRGKEFEFLHMRKRHGLLAKWKYDKLPFTTEFGKNWEAWQVYRELESNTIDEHGQTFIIDEDESSGMSFLNDEHRGKTVILISNEDVINAHLNRHEIFLPDALKLRMNTETIQIFNKPSQHLYYRGLRVADLDKPSAFTYNILAHLDLTEDRTIKYIFFAMSVIRDFIISSTDTAFIKKVLQLDPEKFLEGNLDFDESWTNPGQTFIAIAGEMIQNKITILPRVQTSYDRYFHTENPDPKLDFDLTQSQWKNIFRCLLSLGIDPDEAETTMALDQAEASAEAQKDFRSLFSILREEFPDAEIFIEKENNDEDEIPF